MILPSPRLPPGFQLPPGVGFDFHGVESHTWGTAGLLSLPEVADSVYPLDAAGNERLLWLIVQPHSDSPRFLLAAVYAPTPCDVAFWDSLIT